MFSPILNRMGIYVRRFAQMYIYLKYEHQQAKMLNGLKKRSN